MVTEFSIPTSASAPQGIAPGPDGALWFTEFNGNRIGRITTSGTITEYPIPTSKSFPLGIAAGPDGALWFTESSGNNAGGNNIGRITTAGVISEFPTHFEAIAAPSPGPIVAGPDGNLWFAVGGFVGTVGTFDEFARITTSGTVTKLNALVLAGHATGIAVGPDGALWFGEGSGLGGIGRITSGGTLTAFATPTANSGANGAAAGPDGALWFIEAACGPSCGEPSIPHKVGRISMSGVVNEYPLPNPAASPAGITAGSDGAMWFTETAANQIGRITVPASTGPLVAAVLPSSRSVQVGRTPATAFATIINSGASGANGCAIIPVTPVPASFVYQTTDPATNAPTGSPNSSVTIPAGGSQSFVIALTPNSPVVPTEVALGFDCAGGDAAPSGTGVNALLYSASATPVPDIVALAATATNDGILHISGPSGSNAFAVATVDVGASAAITATANTGSATLPLAISVCQTDPASGQCTSPVGPSVTMTINAGATPTFAIFATESGLVPFDPANNRIFVTFSDAGGTIRGSTSVAVETQ
jgi:streptogramin lyase